MSTERPTGPAHDYAFTVVGQDVDARDGTIDGVVVEYTMPTGERVSASFAFAAWHVMPRAYDDELDAVAADELTRRMNGEETAPWVASQPRRRRR